MSFDGTTFIAVARQLISLSADEDLREAYYRASVSRSYYGVFWAASRVLNEAGGTYTVPNREAHKHVRNVFSSGSTKIQQKLGEDIKRLYWKRVDADYRSVPPCRKAIAESALGQAESICLQLQHVDAKKFT